MTVIHDAPTLVHLFVQRVRLDGEQPALLTHNGEEFVAHAWNDLAEAVTTLAAALVRCGVQPGDMIGQLAENRREWIVADLAIQMAGAVHVPLHAALSAEQTAAQLSHAGVRLAFVSSAEQLQKLADAADQLPPDLTVVLYDAIEPDQAAVSRLQVAPLQEFTAEISPQARAAVQQQALDTLTSDALATVIYTSGTTSQPKGVMLSHGNLVSNALGTLEAYGFGQADLRLNFLPFSHVFARTCELSTWLATGSRLALARSRETLLADAAAVRPTVLNGVPYFFQKVCGHVLHNDLADTPGVVAGLLGGRLKLCCSGGAALMASSADVFQRQEIPLLEGYGLTEASPVITCNAPNANKPGTVGRPIPGVEVRIADDGEVLTRGPHVMLGYLHDDDATRAAIRDGWLHTGDLGELDDEGYLRITGRKKELIVTASGKNVSPSLIEAALCEHPLIEQAVVVGDGRNYLAALLVPTRPLLETALGGGLSPDEDLNARDDVRALLTEACAARCAGLARYEQVRQIHLLPTPLTVEEGDLTPSLKLRRRAVEAKHAAAIDALYADDAD